MQRVCISAILVAWVLACAGAGIQNDAQALLLNQMDQYHDPEAREFQIGIGMDLTSNYGTVAVAFTNGTRRSLGKVNGSETYLGVMRTLSLDSSRHFTPPYNNYYEMWQDRARQAKRRRRKAQGLPASEEVGALADMMTSLRKLAEEYLSQSVDSTLLATPDLAALYREDIEDTFEYLSMKSLEGPYQRFHESAGAEAYHGIGVCKEPANQKSCRDEENQMPYMNLLTVLYTRNSLCVNGASVKSAYGYAADYTFPTSMDFSLGSDALHDNPDEEYYWDAVTDRIITAVERSGTGGDEWFVILIGEDASSPRLREILESVLQRVHGYLPKIYDEEPVFASAIGAAEFVRRGGYPPWRF